MISFRMTNPSRWNSCIGVVGFLASDWYADLLPLKWQIIVSEFVTLYAPSMWHTLLTY
jgi:hypothetical protein